MTTYFIVLIPIYICFITLLSIYMFIRRYEAVKSGEISLGYFRSYQGDLPDHLKVIQNNFNNQFQVPILFFITCLSIVQLNLVTTTSVVLGYAFVLSRLLHAYIHLGRNDVRMRALSYFVGILIILALWFLIIFN